MPNQTTSKQCPRCQIVKELTDFRVDRSKISGYGSHCKACEAARRREWYASHREESAANHADWVDENREYLNAYRRARQSKDTEFVGKNKSRTRQTHEECVEKRKNQARAYYRRTADQQKAYRKEYNATHKKENAQRKARQEREHINYKIANRLRARTRLALRAQSSQKQYTLNEFLGCTPEFLRHWIEQQFRDGMTWDNWGLGDGKWHIDHIRPCASFDLTDPEQQKQCFHYTNLRPLWAIENLSKGGKLCHENT